MDPDPIDEFRPEPGLPPAPEEQRPVWPWVAAVALVAAAVGAWFLYFRDTPETPTPAPPAAAAPAEAAPPPVVNDLGPPPVLEESDDWVRRAVARLSAHPKLARWLVTDDLIRRFVVGVDNLADGVSPRPHLGFLDPGRGFETETRDDRLVLGGAGYQRYDDVAAAFASLDVEGTVALYRSVKPLIQDSYADLGYPDRDFDRTLERAIRHLLAAPVVEGPVDLEPGVRIYEFENPALEALSPAQKHLVRMGPENTRRIQDKLRRLAAALGLEV